MGIVNNYTVEVIGLLFWGATMCLNGLCIRVDGRLGGRQSLFCMHNMHTYGLEAEGYSLPDIWSFPSPAQQLGLC
jgi:hypothetical protein